MNEDPHSSHDLANEITEEKPVAADSRDDDKINRFISTNDDRNEDESFVEDHVSYERRGSSWPPRKQKRTAKTVEPGSLDVLSAKFESLDYDLIENHVYLEEERNNGYKYILKKNISKWFVFLLIGMLTAMIGALIDIAVEELSAVKYKNLKFFVDRCIQEECLYIPHLVWVAMNIIPSLIGSVLVTYMEPVAAGSGIPQVKCYLNGVKIPRVVRIKTLFVKVIGVICSVVGGLAVGKEGPMIHSGAIAAAGVSQGKSTTFKRDFKVLKYFREDHEKRDFVSGGAAAGVAAAFGAPVGGVLFALEEGISFWNQSLTWRIFFCSLISTFTLNIILSSYHGHPGELSFTGLLNFGQFDSLSYKLAELPLFLLMGVCGGLSGALFNFVNYKLTVFRIRYLHQRWLKLLEVAIVSSVTATAGFIMIYALNDCRPLGQSPTKYPIQAFCGDGECNALGVLWFQTPEASVRSLFHDPPGAHKPLSVGVFFIVYLAISCWTYGLSVSSGLFIPALLTGAAWGRLIGMLLEVIFPESTWIDPGKYALLGAAAQLGGVVRMTISLTVILIEATGNIMFGLPLMMTLITAKWTGDYFNDGIYDIHTELQGVPILGWSPPSLSSNIYASEIMSYPVISFSTVERVSTIVDVLKSVSHNGFPVVDEPEPPEETVLKPGGRLRGLILRSQLIVLLKNKLFNELSEDWNTGSITNEMFRDEYPRYPSINEIQLTDEDLFLTVDLRPFMNPSSYTIQPCCSLPRVFRLFRALGLRHLVVVNDRHQVIGMVTRKDLARYRVCKRGKTVGIQELKISQQM